MPQVSVLIPAYNAEKMIFRAIDSALSQTLQDLEVIVVDDASTDGTAALVASRAQTEPRIRLLKREVNGGPAASRNSGLEAARGEWIALLDADDMMLPDRLERMIAAATDEDVLVADNLEMYDIHAQKVVKLGIKPALLGSGLRLDSAGFVSHCHTNQRDAVDFGLLKPLIRMSHLRAQKIVYDGRIRHAEDFSFYLDTLMAGGRLFVLPEAYYRYTERVGSISGKKSGVSMTQARYDMVESQTRALASEPRYASVAGELNLRADALHRLVEISEFNRKSRAGKLASLPKVLSNRAMRGYIASQILAKLRRG